ncbi:MAG: flagellar protein FlaG [Acidobacteria bacterium]|nr:flagellar protein FlaG [Acidobacteriota bacterium]MBI3425670.1 flagellar protein FlaG [Acidobacteriota bacterium]
MQILPLNSINLLNPQAESPAIVPTAAIGTRTQAGAAQTGTGQTGTGAAGNGTVPRTTIGINQTQGEIKLSFPPGQGEAAAEAAQALSEAVKQSQIDLKFSRDDDTGTIVIKLVDQLSGETVQQIPTEALLRLSAALGKTQGQLFDQQA